MVVPTLYRILIKAQSLNIQKFSNDVEARATKLYVQHKTEAWGQIMKVTLPTQAQTKLQGESYTVHSGTIMKVTLPTQAQTKLQGGRGGGGGGGGGNNAPASGVA